MENNLLKQYGSYTFNDDVMKKRLNKNTYEAFHKSLDNKEPLSKEIAQEIAECMKDWAIELGATHFTHWFTPLNGLTAEKHDAFLELEKDKAILTFSGKSLRKGETDASSFPSGGLRATFEARGYTAWDCTSPAFIKDGSLYIPTLFCSYTGEALDNKTPLLKSCEALNKEAVKLLSLIGVKDIQSVDSFVGAEQEYFLVNEEYYEKRLDLKLTGRTLFGANPPKGQDLDGHYYGYINTKISNFMKELDNELWKFGIPSKTKHNESAPAQHEIACIYRNVNTTADNNNLVMQIIQDIAKKHGLRCLLHEKPFNGVNGSGKHNNWSVVTNTNVNLFKPGNDPMSNIPFLATLACIVKGVDEYADLLRMSIASASNDHRLGGNEAPPATISMFLGENISGVVEAIIQDKQLADIKKTRFQTGVSVIPDFAKDNTDRNRTSPFAFTGNKFEFRGVGSSQSIALANTMLNSILAIEMKEMSTLLENGETIYNIIKKFFTDHKRIIFEGNGYSDEWEAEVVKRGLPNRKNAVDAINCLKDEKTIKPLIELGIHTNEEIISRHEVLLDSYSKTIQVEALTTLKMSKNQIFPSCLNYINNLSMTTINLEQINVDSDFVKKELIEVTNLVKDFKTKIENLKMQIDKVQSIKANAYEVALLWKDNVLLAMNELRKVVDKLETIVDSKYWPMPTYTNLLFDI